MRDGLIHSAEGQQLLLGVWLVLGVLIGFIVTLVLTVLGGAARVVLGSRSDSAGRDGRSGVGWWLLGIWGLCVGPPIVIMLGMVIKMGLDWATGLASAYWWVGVMLLAGGLTAAAIGWAWRRRPAQQLAPVIAQSERPLPEPPPPMWGLPVNQRDGGL